MSGFANVLDTTYTLGMGALTPSEPDTTGGTMANLSHAQRREDNADTASPPEVARTAPTQAGAWAAPPAGLGTGAEGAGAARDPGRRGRVAAEDCGEAAKNLWGMFPTVFGATDELTRVRRWDKNMPGKILGALPQHKWVR